MSEGGAVVGEGVRRYRSHQLEAHHLHHFVRFNFRERWQDQKKPMEKRGGRRSGVRFELTRPHKQTAAVDMNEP